MQTEKAKFIVALTGEERQMKLHTRRIASPKSLGERCEGTAEEEKRGGRHMLRQRD